MSDPVRLRIDYGRGLEEADATPLGPAPRGGELFRVHRPSFAIGNVGRDDVVRLEPVGNGTWRWIAVVELSNWRTISAPVPPESRDTAALAEFRREVEAAGCIWEGEFQGEWMWKAVISLPPGTPDRTVGVPHERMLLATAGLTFGQLEQRIVREQVAEKLERQRRHGREQRARHRAGLVTSVRQGAGSAFAVFVLLVVVGWAAWALAHAAPTDRPRVAALAMTALLAPIWITALRERRDFALLWLPSTVGAIGAVLVLRAPEPSTSAYTIAMVIGTLHALWTGGIGVILGIFSMFASSSREFGRAILGIALPAVLSGVAGAVLALATAGAAGSLGGLASGAQLVAVGLTALLLLAPVLVTLVNAGAILGGRAWRSAPGLQRQALLALPREMLPVFGRVGLPIAAIWALVGLLRLVAR
jgi:hypothetical protein